MSYSMKDTSRFSWNGGWELPLGVLSSPKWRPKNPGCGSSVAWGRPQGRWYREPSRAFWAFSQCWGPIRTSTSLSVGDPQQPEWQGQDEDLFLWLWDLLHGVAKRLLSPSAGIAPNITRGPLDSTVIDGMSVVLACETSGAPRPAITWQKGRWD